MMAKTFGHALAEALGLKNCLRLPLTVVPNKVDTVTAEVYVPGSLETVIHEFNLYSERKPQPARPVVPQAAPDLRSWF